MTGETLARLDAILRAEPLNATANLQRAVIMLELDNPQEIAHSARMLMQLPECGSRAILDHCIIRLLNAAEIPANVSIGGGASYHYAGWRNFDSAKGPLNPVPVRFHARTELPYPDAAARIVYSSHCLEHLDDATVDRVLHEARRVLRADGALVLKLPDFEQVLERWRAGDEAYFDQWGLQDVIPTWKNMGVEPTIHAKAAMIFCGWWNDAYGDEFGKRTPDAEGAYHGPVICDQALSDSPHRISSDMRSAAPQGAHFNHQNAWGRAQLEMLLQSHGFDVISMDADEICRKYADIPGITDQRAISMYAVAA